MYFVEIITLLVVEIYHYYHDYVDRLDDRRFPEHDVTEAKIFVFLALTIQMGHGVRDKLTDYWATRDHLYTLFYGTMMKWDRYQPSFVTYILLTTGMNLIGRTKILTDYGRYETCFKF
jgi:hypothetical protein